MSQLSRRRRRRLLAATGLLASLAAPSLASAQTFEATIPLTCGAANPYERTVTLKGRVPDDVGPGERFRVTDLSVELTVTRSAVTPAAARSTGDVTTQFSPAPNIRFYRIDELAITAEGGTGAVKGDTSAETGGPLNPTYPQTLTFGNLRTTTTSVAGDGPVVLRLGALRIAENYGFTGSAPIGTWSPTDCQPKVERDLVTVDGPQASEVTPIDTTVPLRCVVGVSNSEEFKLRIRGDLRRSPGEEGAVRLTGLDASIEYRNRVALLPLAPPAQYPDTAWVDLRRLGFSAKVPGTSVGTVTELEDVPVKLPPTPMTASGFASFSSVIGTGLSTEQAPFLGGEGLQLRLSLVEFEWASSVGADGPRPADPQYVSCQQASGSDSIKVLKGDGPLPSAPQVTSVTPDRATYGSDLVEVTVKGTGFLQSHGVRIDGPDGRSVLVEDPYLLSETELTFPLAADMPTGRVSVRVLSDYGTSDDTPADDLELLSNDPPSIPTDFAVTGSAALKTLVKGAAPLTGSLSGFLVDDATGTAGGTLALDRSTAKLVALGFLPVTADLQLVATEPLSGTRAADGRLSLTAKLRIKLPKVTLFGLSLAGGTSCQARQVSSVPLASVGAFSTTAPSTLAGTFGISDLTGCGALTGIVSPLTSGKGNAITLGLTPKG